MASTISMVLHPYHHYSCDTRARQLTGMLPGNRSCATRPLSYHSINGPFASSVPGNHHKQLAFLRLKPTLFGYITSASSTTTTTLLQPPPLTNLALVQSSLLPHISPNSPSKSAYNSE